MTYDDDQIARLVIAGAYPEDDGIYKCTASNSAGTASSTCHLFVKGNSGENLLTVKITVKKKSLKCTEREQFAINL